jgi:hypothetical protein
MYGEEKKGNVTGLILMFVVLVLAGAVLSYLYVGLIDVVMHIYLNPLIMIFFGVALAFLVNALKKGLKITNNIGAAIVTVVGLVIVNYMMWNMFFGMWHMRYSGYDMNPFLNIGDFFYAFRVILLDNMNNPAVFFEDFRVFNYYGTWSYNDNMVTGFILGALWIIEFLVINTLAVISSAVSPGFFLHEKNAWAQPVFYEAYNFRTIDKDTLDSVEQGTEELINALEAAHIKHGEADTGTQMVLAVMYHDNEKTDYVGLYRVDKNNGEVKKGGLFNAFIDIAIAGNRLVKAFKLSPERINALEAELERRFAPPVIVEAEEVDEADDYLDNTDNNDDAGDIYDL